MVIINIGIGTDKKAVSRLAITLDDSDSSAGEINCAEVVEEIHTLIWRYLRRWADQNITVNINRRQ